MVTKTQYTMGGSPVLTTPLKRVSAGFYTTPDGRYEVYRAEDGCCWVWRDNEDRYAYDDADTKWAVVHKLASYLRGVHDAPRSNPLGAEELYEDW